MNFKMNFKKIAILLFSVSLLFTLFYQPSAFAETVDTANDGSILGNLHENQYGDFKAGGKNHYLIDAVSPDDAKSAKSGSFWGDLKESMFGWTDFGGNISDKFNFLLLMFISGGMQLNVFLTDSLLSILSFSMEFDIVSLIINAVGDKISAMTGISNGNISGGLFDAFFIGIILIVGIYLVYLVIVKRAFIDSMGQIVKTLISLIVALVIFSNFSTYINGANTLANEATKVVLNAVNKTNEDKSINDIIWTMLVDRPYLTLQYGTYDADKIGKTRIERLLKMEEGEARKQEVLLKEVVANDNKIMILNSTTERMLFSGFYLLLNAFIAIPILLLAVVLIALQFWYVAVAILAPFALLLSLLPNSFGILKRYAVELFIPLGLKIFFAFFTVMILFLTSVIFEVNATQFGNGKMLGYIVTGILQFIMFVVIFLLRKRIMAIFTSGSELINTMRENARTVSPLATIKQGTQTALQATGAVIGGVAGSANGAGALAGARVGSSLGKMAGRTLTGEAGLSESVDHTLQAATQAQMLGRLAEVRNASKGDVPVPMNKKQQKNAERFFELNGIEDKETQQNIISSLEKNGLQDATYDEMKTAYVSLEKDFVEGNIDSENTSVGNEIVGRIREQRTEEANNEAVQKMTSLFGEPKKPEQKTSGGKVDVVVGQESNFDKNTLFNNNNSIPPTIAMSEHASKPEFNPSTLYTEESTQSDAYFDYISQNIPPERAESVIVNETINTTENLVKNENLNTTENVVKNENLNTTENVVKNENLNTTENVVKNENLNTTENVVKNESLNTTENVVKNESLNTTENVVKNESLNTTENVVKNESLNTTKNAVVNENFNTTKNNKGE